MPCKLYRNEELVEAAKEEESCANLRGENQDCVNDLEKEVGEIDDINNNNNNGEDEVVDCEEKSMTAGDDSSQVFELSRPVTPILVKPVSC